MLLPFTGMIAFFVLLYSVNHNDKLTWGEFLLLCYIFISIAFTIDNI